MRELKILALVLIALGLIVATMPAGPDTTARPHVGVRDWSVPTPASISMPTDIDYAERLGGA